MTQVSQTVDDFQTDHEDLLCAACGHLGQAHDTTALRYCRATAASGVVRGCLCSPNAGHTGVQPLRTTQRFR
jgi:hypothetical protein